MKVAILQAMETEPDQIIPFFKRFDAPFDCQVFEITRGAYPDTLDVYDAFIISGSKKSVYDPDPWIADLATFIKRCSLEQRKLIGICFGHQILAHTLGGYSAKSEKGWGLGLRTFEIKAQKPWMDPAIEQCSLFFSHQDQVKTLPAGAELLGGNAFCPNAIYSIEDRVLGIQGHPELTHKSMVQIIERLKGSIGGEAYSDALNSLNRGDPDACTVARWIINFIRL